MSAEIVPIGNYLPPLDLEPVVLQDKPATIIILPVIRTERRPKREGFRVRIDMGLPSDVEP